MSRWAERPIAALANYINGNAFKPADLGDEGVPVIRIRELLDPTAEPDRYNGDVRKNAVLADDDLVFSWSGSLEVRTWDRGVAYLNQHLFRVVPAPGVFKPWLRWGLLVAVDRLRPFMHGSAMTHITKPMMKAVRLPLPPLSDQERIADFLDMENERIDTLIGEYQRQIELVEEEWEQERLRATGWDGAPVARILLKRCFSESHYGIGTSAAEVGEVAVLGMGNLVGGEVVGTPSGFVDKVEPQLLLRAGDLLFNRTNSLAHVGKTALVRSSDPKTTCASYVVIFRTNDRADAEFLNFSLNSIPMRSLATAVAVPSIGQANLNPTRYGQLSIPLPDLRTQRKVAENLREHRLRGTRLVVQSLCGLGLVGLVPA